MENEDGEGRGWMDRGTGLSVVWAGEVGGRGEEVGGWV